MKQLIRYLPIAAVMLRMVMATAYAQTGGTGRNTGGANTQQRIVNLPKETLSDEEITSLTHMREEEKLARDVYLALYDQWGIPVFRNIASSEQQHTDRIRILLDLYELDDPFVDERGVFTNADLGSLYSTLVEQGSSSLVEGLTVGMTIEDLDLYDLEEALEMVDNQDIHMVYQNLMKGSRNHLRSFYSELTARGGSYEPQYISVEEYEAILAGDMERGPADQDGNGVFNPGTGRGGNRGRSGKRGSGDGTCTSTSGNAVMKAGHYPNPANPGTMITFSLSAAAPASITIYNAIGQRVRFYDLGYREAGEYLQHWDALDINGQPVTSGLYLYRIQAGNSAVTNRLMLIR